MVKLTILLLILHQMEYILQQMEYILHQMKYILIQNHEDHFNHILSNSTKPRTPVLGAFSDR